MLPGDANGATWTSRDSRLGAGGRVGLSPERLPLQVLARHADSAARASLRESGEVVTGAGVWRRGWDSVCRKVLTLLKLFETLSRQNRRNRPIPTWRYVLSTQPPGGPVSPWNLPESSWRNKSRAGGFWRFVGIG